MKRYQLNFSLRQKPAFPASAIRLLGFFLVLVLMTLLAIREAGSALEKAQTLRNSGNRRASDARIEEIRQQISAIKSRWQKSLSLANSLLAMKESPLLGYLDQLEQTLPDGVSLSNLRFAADRSAILELTVRSPNSADLLKLYGNWRPFGLNILRESEQGGVIVSQLTLDFSRRGKDEK